MPAFHSLEMPVTPAALPELPEQPSFSANQHNQFLLLEVSFYTKTVHVFCHVSPPSSWPRCSDTRLALGAVVSSELPSSPLDGSPLPAGRTPAPQTAWSQTPELQLSVHKQRTY